MSWRWIDGGGEDGCEDDDEVGELGGGGQPGQEDSQSGHKELVLSSGWAFEFSSLSAW